MAKGGIYIIESNKGCCERNLVIMGAKYSFHLWWNCLSLKLLYFLIIMFSFSWKSSLLEVVMGDFYVWQLLYIFTDDRENEQLSKYGDTKTARSIMLIELKKLIEANPLFREKLVFPALKSSRLRTLINQRYNCSDLTCKQLYISVVFEPHI